MAKASLFTGACTAALLVSGDAFAAAVTASGGAGSITNPLSAFPVTVDGAFTNADEWSDTTPLAFIAPATDDGTLFQTTRDDPRANVFVYAAIAPGAVAPNKVTDGALYLLYEYLDRTQPTYAPGELAAKVAFPIRQEVCDSSGCGSTVIAGGVQITGAQLPVATLAAASALGGGPTVLAGNGECVSDTGTDNRFDCTALDTNGKPTPSPRVNSDLNLATGVSFGKSRERPAAPDHLIVELEVPLLIPAGFADPSSRFDPPPPGNDSTGYSPDPAFWGVFASNDLVDPPISSAIFELNPDGGTTIIPTAPLAPPVPEPATLSLLAFGIAGSAGLRRRRRRQFPGR